MKGTITKIPQLFGEDIPTVIPEATRKLIEEVLTEYPESRNDDMILLGRVWQKQGLNMDLEMFLKYCYPAETITRWRRKLQESGKFQADKQVQVGRERQQDKFEDYFRNN